MDKAELITLLNENKPCCLATAQGGQPHVRGMLIYQADENGLLFQTTRVKKLYHQLQENPRVELCFICGAQSLQIRVIGVAHEVDDAALKQQILSEQGFLSEEISDAGPESLAVFRVSEVVATLWSFNRRLDDQDPVVF